MVFNQNEAFLSPGPQSPLQNNEEDDTVNYTQQLRESSVPEGDLFFLSIVSPLSWVDDVGEESFIHNPKDGPYTPVHSSTPLHNASDSVSDGYQTPTKRNSPYVRQSRSRSPPASQRECRALHNATRTPSPRQGSTQQRQTSPPSQGTEPAEGVTRQHVILSLEMAEASQGHWIQKLKSSQLSFAEQCQAHANYLGSDRLVRHYTAVLYQMEASEKALGIIRGPLPKF